MNNRDKIIQKLIKIGALETKEERVLVEETIGDSSAQYSDDEIGTTASGTKYVKKIVMQYLMEKGLPMTEDMIEIAAQFATVSNNQLKTQHYETEYHHELENASDEEVQEYLDYALIEQVVKLRKFINDSILENSLMEYSVEVIRDNSTGGTDISKLQKVLQEKSDKGWRLVNTFTNELGVNSRTENVLGTSYNTNATIDQVVMIFERPRYLNDKYASDIIKKYFKK